MGMAEIKIPETPKPRCKNTVVCPKCLAEYNPKIKWVRGFVANDRNSTEPVRYYAQNIVPENCCPCCLEKRK